MSASSRAVLDVRPGDRLCPYGYESDVRWQVMSAGRPQPDVFAITALDDEMHEISLQWLESEVEGVHFIIEIQEDRT